MSATAKLSSAPTGVVAPPAATDDSASWIEAEKSCDGQYDRSLPGFLHDFHLHGVFFLVGFHLNSQAMNQLPPEKQKIRL